MPHPKNLEAYEPWIHQVLEKVWESKEPFAVPMPSRGAAINWRQRIYTYRKVAMKHAPEMGAHRWLTIQIRLEEVPQVGTVLVMDPQGSGMEYFAAAFADKFGEELEGWGDFEQTEEQQIEEQTRTGDPMYHDIASRAREETKDIDVAEMIRNLGASSRQDDPPQPEAPAAASPCQHQWLMNNLINEEVCEKCGMPKSKLEN